MIARPVRVYADTSVFGGVFDVEFRATSRAFFDQVEDGRFRRVVSAVVEEEIQPAPAHVRDFYDSMLPLAEPAQVTTEVINLRDAYLDAGIVPPRRSNEAVERCAPCGAGDGVGLLADRELELQGHRPFREDPAVQCDQRTPWTCGDSHFLADGAGPV